MFKRKVFYLYLASLAVMSISYFRFVVMSCIIANVVNIFHIGMFCFYFLHQTQNFRFFKRRTTYTEMFVKRVVKFLF